MLGLGGVKERADTGSHTDRQQEVMADSETDTTKHFTF